MSKLAGGWEDAVLHSELSSGLCDGLEGWDGGVEGRHKRRGIYVYT